MSEDFIRANTAWSYPPLVPEIGLYLATEITPIWKATEDRLAEIGLEPPFWAFAWPGSQALARYVLDNPALVAGKRVLDFAAGSGLAGIACKMAGATLVEAVEIDALAVTATVLNARANNVELTALNEDLVGSDCRWDLILCGDICYEAPMTGHILPWLRAMTVQADVWIADPGRAYVPRAGMAEICRFMVPTTLELEGRSEREVVLYRLDLA